MRAGGGAEENDYRWEKLQEQERKSKNIPRVALKKSE